MGFFKELFGPSSGKTPEPEAPRLPPTEVDREADAFVRGLEAEGRTAEPLKVTDARPDKDPAGGRLRAERDAGRGTR